MAGVRDLADRYLDRLLPLDPYLATMVGESGYDDRLTDYSVDGVAARAALARETLADLGRTEALDEADRLCGALAARAAGRRAGRLRRRGAPAASCASSARRCRPSARCSTWRRATTDDDWANIATRLAAVPEAYERLESALRTGMAKGHLAAPRQALACAEQTATWAGLDDGRPPWFADLAAAGPEARRAELDRAAASATEALVSFTRFLRDEYAPRAEGVPDAVGRDRYVVRAREFLGGTLDVDDAYAYGWAELERIEDDMRSVGAGILPGASMFEVYAHLDAQGETIEGEQALLAWLQGLMDETMDALDGTHFDLSGDVRKVEAVLAPPGSAAAAYYTPPSQDYSRPGQTWYPTLGRTRFPIWEDVSTWYHEGVPGHHLQLGGWVAAGDRLSRYQRIGLRLGRRRGVGALRRAAHGRARVLHRPGPAHRLPHRPAAPGRRASSSTSACTARCRSPRDSPSTRASGGRPSWGWSSCISTAGPSPTSSTASGSATSACPGQAISYKLGERVWLAGREAARRAKGAAFDLKAWHTAALLQGPLGLDDLARESAVQVAARSDGADVAATTRPASARPGAPPTPRW